MDRTKRVELLKKLQDARAGRLCIAYVTSTRSGHEIEMADDVVPILHGHLEAGDKDARERGIDLLIHSNGGSTTAPWRIVSLIREYTKHFAVLVPHKAFSAATITALGADEIVMHPMGCLGPIDPSVANVFNPSHPQAPGNLAQISVEDVTAYFKLVNEEVKKAERDDLTRAFSALTDKVHPLALGNVQRSHSQSRMMARKLLKMHMESSEHEEAITEIIENLKSNLFFHGHPISRAEAKNDLKLKVVSPPASVGTAMWDLYRAYEERMKMAQPFSALHELEQQPPPSNSPPTTSEIIVKLKELAAQGITLGGVTEEQFVKLAAAIVAAQKQAAPGKLKLDGMLGAYVESVARADVFKTDLRLERATIVTGSGAQEAVRAEVAWQRWESE